MLTGTGKRFSAGLDLGEHFPLFAGDRGAVASWFSDYRATNMRLFTYPRPTVAALNGHAFAGGLITAAVCDYRVPVADEARIGLNEVPIGIPMPAVYVRMLGYAWGEPVAARTCLLGEIFTPAQAHEPGMVHELAPAEELLERAVAIAELDEVAGRLERFAALRDTDSAAADAVLDELGATSDVDRDIVVQLSGRAPLAYPDRFFEAHALAMRALEVLDHNGARRVRVKTPRGLGFLRPPTEFVVQLVTRIIVRSYQSTVIDRLLYAILLTVVAGLVVPAGIVYVATRL